MSVIQRKQLIELAALFLLVVAVIYRIDNHTDWFSVSLHLIDMGSHLSTQLLGDSHTVSIDIAISSLAQIKLLL